MIGKSSEKQAEKQFVEFIENRKLDKDEILSFIEKMKQINPENIREILLEKKSDNIFYDFFAFLIEKKGKNPEEIEEYLKHLDVDTIRAAYNYEERKVALFKLVEAIEWVQDHFDEKKHVGACVLKEQSEKEIVLKICFLGLDKKPLSKMGDLYLKVIAKSIDQDCIDAFGDKDMVVFG